MGKHFSSQELYELRNSIPMDGLIEKELGIPSKISEGFFCCNYSPPSDRDAVFSP